MSAVSRCALVAMVAACAVGATASAAPPVHAETAALVRRFAPIELLLCFMGKGSCLPYDAGVLHEAHSRIPAIGKGNVIVAGNSSGGIPAAYFCCHGFSDATVRHAEERLKNGDRNVVRNMENVSTKIAKLARGEPTEIRHADLREYVAFALGVESWRDTRDIAEIVRRSQAHPRYPCLIVACNREVLEDRHPEDAFSPAGSRNSTTGQWRCHGSRRCTTLTSGIPIGSAGITHN